MTGGDSAGANGVRPQQGLRALSIQAPWTEFIFEHGKDVENRTWRTRYRGPVLIHQSKRGSRKAFNADVYWAEERKLIAHGLVNELWLQTWDDGAIIGVVDIVDCVDHSDSRWFCGPHGLVLANPLSFSKTIPCKGRLGFFTPLADVLARAAELRADALAALPEGDAA